MSHIELQEYLGVSDEQFDKLLPENESEREVPYIRIGHEYYYPVKAVDKWLTEIEAETIE
ncbi:DNA-binding protein [Halobacillus massiliensis]|uniref:DNA-binding protein n=1 Tax=Halobacillus massiliensis TaxID=1926286 RepID=UPI0009E60D5C|nr:DNA-binding protein [Halobacillus massiliensis]